MVDELALAQSTLSEHLQILRGWSSPRDSGWAQALLLRERRDIKLFKESNLPFPACIFLFLEHDFLSCHHGLQ